MVAADDQVGTAMVLANDGMPDGFPRPAHAHGQWQQGEHGGVFRVVGHQRLVAADSGVVIDVARFGHSNDRVNEQIGIRLFGRAQGQFLMRPMHRVSGLESDNFVPTMLGKFLSKLFGCGA